MTKTPITTPKKNKLDNLRRGGFEKEQPTSEAKKQWREERRKKMKMQEVVIELLTMWLNDKTLEDLKEEYYDSKDWKLQPKGDKKPIDHIIASYIMKSIKDPNMMKDIINRYVWYAPSKMELTGKDGEEFKNPVMNINLLSNDELLKIALWK